MRCPSCGVEGEGNFCTRCGESLAGDGRTCGACGASLQAGDLFCAQCGEATGERPARSFATRLPWILSAVVLVLFSVGIALLVQRWTSPRPPGGTITGGIPPAEGAATAGGEGQSAPGSGGAMPSAAELAAMSPRTAADRLFDRAMREREGGDAERAAFFARMGLQAYARVPPAEMDDDARFHVGLLHLAGGDLEAAGAVARALLDEDPNHLFGLVLGARAAEAGGDARAAREYRVRLRAAIETGAASPRDPRYEAHAGLIEQEAAGDGRRRPEAVRSGEGRR